MSQTDVYHVADLKLVKAADNKTCETDILPENVLKITGSAREI